MPVSNVVQIKLSVLFRKQISANSLALSFQRPAGFDYEAGDWIDIKNYGPELRGGKVYSLSSSPTESDLTIMFRKGLSQFKQYLQNLEAGDELQITQFGNGYSFHLRENRSSVLIAGGIGIAPFRSMLKEMADTSSTNNVQLLYFNKGPDFLLNDELNEWESTLNLDLHCINTEQLKRKDRLKVFKEDMNLDAHHYFIAGPESMVESTEHLLIDLGINPKDIRIDSFGGY